MVTGLPFDLDAEVVRLMRAGRIALPVYPGVALQLQQLIAGDDYGAAELARLVEADQSLATAVMRTANSALYAVPNPITTLGVAIARVGANSLNNLAVASTLGLQASLEGPLASLRKESWRRSLISALLCQHLAPRRGLDPGEAFLAGLLHDFGETIACACFEALLAAHPQTRPLPATTWLPEVQRYHVELGMALAAQWKLPEFVSSAVMRHHEPELEGAVFPELVQLVALTDTLNHRLAEASSIEGLVLSGIAGLDRAELAPLEQVLLAVPSFLESFDVPRAGKHATPVPSLVAPPPSTLGDHAKPVQLPLTVDTRDSRTEYQAVVMSPSGLLMEGALPQAERRLIHLALAGVKVYATVTRCVSAGPGWAIEVKPFAMDKPSQAAWSRLLHQAPRQPAGAGGHAG